VRVRRRVADSQRDRPGAEFCHVRAHRGWHSGKPSGRETGDLVHGCHCHHDLYDEGPVILRAGT
jgi:hypothetical protein